MDFQGVKVLISGIISNISLFLSFCTFLFTAITLLYSYKFAKDSNKIGVIAQKRSKRIDEMRQSSSRIISNAECLVRKLDGKNKGKYKAALEFEVNNFVSQLQYIYKKDIELIDLAKSIADILCCNQPLEDDKEIKMLINRFWYCTDLYIGTEFERLKREAIGKVEKSGGLKDASMTFDCIYKHLEKESKITRPLQKHCF